MEEQFVNCLICNDYFEEKPLPSLVTAAQGILGGGGGGEDITENGQLFSKWKAAFQLFSRLLSADTARFDCDVNKLQLVFEKWATRRMTTFQSPCCSSCSPVLFEIAKIQVTIDESMKTQLERVNELKRKLINNLVVNQDQDPLGDDNDTGLDFEWDNSISDAEHTPEPKPELSVQAKMDPSAVAASFDRKRSSRSSNAPAVKPKPRSKKRKYPSRKRPTEVAKQAETIKAVTKMETNLEMRQCVVLLERLVPKGNDGTPVPSTSSRVRKSKLKAFEVLRKRCLPPGTGVSMEAEEEEEEEVASKRIKKSSKSKKESEEGEDDEWMAPQNDESDVELDDNDDGDDNNYEVEPKSKGQRLTEKTVGIKIGDKKVNGIRISRKSVASSRGVAKANLFFLVQEKFLLYKLTMIEVHLRKKMICKEASCTFEVAGIDSFAFDKIRKHVNNSHLTESNYPKKTRPCHICKKIFFGTALKVHLLEEHQPVNPVCEICWKPLNHVSMPEHTFFHKNAEERKAAIAIVEATSSKGDRSLPAYMLKLGENPEPPSKPHQPKSTMEKSTEVEDLKETRKRRTNSKRTRWFHVVDDGHLLYAKRSLVKVIHCQKLECEECNFIVEGTSQASLQEMREHLEMAHLKKSNSCSAQLQPCPLCPMSYLGAYLKTHFTDHHQLPLDTMICEICWRPLCVTSDPRLHMWLHKSKQEKQLAISAGGKDFGKKYQNRKKVVDSTFPSLVCPTCGKTFKVQDGLKRHEMTHLPRDLRPLFQCEYCPEKLLSEVTLRSHIERSHRPDLIVRWRVCRICDKKFHHGDPQLYMAHMRTHTDERPFVCDTCGISFTVNDSLRKHIRRVHSTERPYQCEFCEMTYRHRPNLTRHQRALHPDQVKKESDWKPARKCRAWEYWQHRKNFIGPQIAYPCEFCGKVFQWRSKMTQHVSEKHRAKLEKQRVKQEKHRFKQEKQS